MYVSVFCVEYLSYIDRNMSLKKIKSVTPYFIHKMLILILSLTKMLKLLVIYIIFLFFIKLLGKYIISILKF